MNKKIVVGLLIGLAVLVGGCSTNFRQTPGYDEYCQSVGFDFAEQTYTGGTLDTINFRCANEKGGLVSGEIFGNEYQSGYYFIDQVNELGQSICDQEYKMDFDYYFEKTLHCKSKTTVQTKKYDGIGVSIEKEESVR